MRVKKYVNEQNLHTERQWAEKGYVKNDDAVGEKMWSNRFCQHSFVYYSESEVHKATTEELDAYWLPIEKKQSEKRKLKRRQKATEKKAEQERIAKEQERQRERHHQYVLKLQESCEKMKSLLGKYVMQAVSDEVATADLVVLDIETTGLNPNEDEILQVSIVSGTGEVLLDTYINPLYKSDWEEAQNINGISPDMVKDAPCIFEVIPKINAILSEAKKIVGYNHINFDFEFLDRWGVVLPRNAEYIDVMFEFAPIYGEWNDYYQDYKWQSLATCAYYFGYDWGEDKAHDGAADCRATLFCYNKLKALKEENS